MRTRIRRGVAVALTVSALTLTAACGGSSDKGGDSAAKGKDKETGTEAPAATPLTAAQMKAGILEVKDLPAGWKAESAPSTEDQAKAEKPECQPLAQLMSDKIDGATMGGNQEFANGDGTSLLAQQIFSLPGTGAADFVKGVQTALGACATFTVVQDGQKVPVKAVALPTAKAGESSTGVRLTMEIPELQMKIESDVLVAQQGTGVMRLAYVPMNGEGHKSFDDLAKRGGDKFVKAAQG
jgi:predicted RecA/RadA family phage recombinase